MKNELVMGILGGLLSSSAYAFIAPQNAPAGVKVRSTVLRPSTYKTDVSSFDADVSEVRLDRQTNSIRQMVGQDLLGVVVSDISKNAIEQAALDVISRRADIFGVDVADVRLNEKATHVDANDQFVSFNVLRNGLKIQDAGITLRFKQGHLAGLKSEAYAEAVISPSSVTNTGDIAAQSLNSRGYISRGSAWRVVPTAAGYNLIKVDEYVVAGADAAWIVQVNTTNGELYEVRSKNFNMQGRAVASVYPRYFGEQIQDTALPFSKVTNASARANDRGEFQSIDDFSAPKMDGLSGQYVSVHNEAGANLSATAVKSGNSWALKFDIKPSAKLWDNKDMAQAMVYVNTNKVINYAKKYIQPTWFNTPLTANVNHAQTCNAYWDGETINFFSAGTAGTKECANTGTIADVVFHEWGHGLDENTGGIQDHAMSEGFGDALSVIFTNDSRVGVEFRPLEHKPVRDLSILKKFPDDIVNEVHADGLIVGGAWYDTYLGLRAELGLDAARDLYSKFLFKGIYAAAKMSDVYDATLAIDDNDQNVANGTPHFCIINKAFAKHGLAKLAASCN